VSNLNDIINQQREEIGQLREQLEKANERGEELQDALVDDAKAKAMLNKLTMENGELSIKASGNIFHVFCEAFVETFKGSGATNYLVAEFNSEELGAFTVTMQRSEGLTVYQKLNEANERVAELESQHQLLTMRIEPLLDMQEDGELYARCHLADDIYESFVEGSSVDALNKFTIEQQIEALAHVLSSYKTQKFCPTNYAIQAFNDGVAHLWAHIVNCELQLRKGGES
tara:strand:+ start:44042 stop:44725 length:684 start_codon:yes stop_codon:yes gene_type:complete